MVLYTRDDTTKTTSIFQGAIFNVWLYDVNKDGTVSSREIVEHNGGVVIACMPDPDEVILIRQYRFAVDEELLELPAGRVELGEDRLLAAQRELTEETGFKAKDWLELPPMFSAPGFCTELLTFYLARNVEFVGKNLDYDEETEVVRVSLKEAWQLVVDGKVRDCKTVAALGIICHSKLPV